MLELFADQGVRSDAIDVNDKAVELLVTKLHIDFLGHRSQIVLLFVGVGDIHGPPVNLEFSIAAVMVCDGVVDRAAWISNQVQRLTRLPSHTEIKLTIEEQRFHRRYSGEPVLPQGSQHHQPVTV